MVCGDVGADDCEVVVVVGGGGCGCGCGDDGGVVATRLFLPHWGHIHCLNKSSLGPHPVASGTAAGDEPATSETAIHDFT